VNDILSRLIARAQGSPVSLTRRVRYRFAPVGDHAEAWSPHEESDARSGVPELRPAEARSARSRAAGRTDELSTKPLRANPHEGEFAPEPGDAVSMAERPVEALPAASSEREVSRRLVQRSLTDTDGERSLATTRSAPPPFVPGIADAEPTAPIDIHEGRLVESGEPEFRVAETIAPRRSATQTGAEATGASDAMTAMPISDRMTSHPGGGRTRPTSARPEKPPGAVPVVQRHAGRASDDSLLASVGSSRPEAAKPAAEAGFTATTRHGGPIGPEASMAAATDGPHASFTNSTDQAGQANAPSRTPTIRHDQALPGDRAEIDDWSRPVAVADVPASKADPLSSAAHAHRTRRTAEESGASSETRQTPHMAAPSGAIGIDRRPGRSAEHARGQEVLQRPSPVDRDTATPVAQRREISSPRHPPPTSTSPDRIPTSSQEAKRISTHSSADQFPPPEGAGQMTSVRPVSHDRAPDRLGAIGERPGSAPPNTDGRSASVPEATASSRAVALRPTTGDDAAPPRSFPDSHSRRGRDAAPAPPQTPQPTSDEIHIEIGRIQIELPRARRQRSRPEPPPLQGKPRGGPNG
jgi:hypothetical protein